jgi:lipoate-protein ligase B
MFATRLLDIDHLVYTEALALMRGLVELKKGSAQPEILMLLEHEPILTMGRRSDVCEIRVSQKYLEAQGIGVHRIERGGLITYHGPGQLVAYVIFDLKRMRLGVSELVQALEAVILDTLSDFGIRANRIEGYRGVWVGNEKIASIGIAVRRGITFHGLALNYNPNLLHFEMILPCGLEGVKMTSMSKILQAQINPRQLRDKMARHFSVHFNLEFLPWSLEQAQALINVKDSV